MFITSSLVLLMAMSGSTTYPMQDTDFLKSAYCFYLSESPRLSTDLSNSQKKAGEDKYFHYLIDHNLDLPRGEDAKAIKMTFIYWVMGNFGHSKNPEIVKWYISNCTTKGGA